MFGSRLPDARYAEFFTTTYLESSKYLPWLTNSIATRSGPGAMHFRFVAKGGKMVKRHLSDIKEICQTYDVICNCTGLGSYDLFGDTSVYPVRGQVIKVHAPHIKNFAFYMPYYVLLNDEVVTLGGTMQKGNWSTQPDPKTSELIWDTCAKLCPSIKVVHNYGHGGSGLTMFYGSSKDASNMLKDCVHRRYSNAKL